MRHLSESILDLLKEAACTAGETQNEQLAIATLRALDASISDGVIGATDALVYQSIMREMVQSGALKVVGQETISAVPLVS